MYNLNVNLAMSTANAVNNLLAVENACTTPRTPEILNSLIAMTNPLDNYSFGDDAPKSFITGPPTLMSNDSNSSSCSQVDSPTNTPPSVQHTCSQLIKAGLKLSIEQKRKLNGDGEDLLDLDNCKRVRKGSESEKEDKCNNNGIEPNKFGKRRRSKLCEEYWDTNLTAEDEERRRRRRERNKIAATKCRLKKRERTANLINEAETLETQNIDLKTQVQDLQTQRRQLVEMLTIHRSHCTKNIQPPSRDKLGNRLPPMSSLPASVIENSHSYSRPASVDANYKAQNYDIYNRPASVGVTTHDVSYNRPAKHYSMPPNIIVETADSYQPQLTNLDNQTNGTYLYSNQQCHNYNGTTQNYNSTGMDNGCMA